MKGYGKYLWLMCACIASSVHAQTTVDSSFHIYLLLGQSNMAGRGEITEEYKQQSHSRVLALDKTGEWVAAAHPLHFDKPKVAGVGPGLCFGIKMAEADSRVTIGLVPCAVGGTSINSWVPGGYDPATKTHPYDEALVRIKAAMKYGVVKGILWHQGESDAGNAQTYLPKLIAFITQLRREIDNEHLPFVAGELGSYKQSYSRINSEITKLPFVVSCTAVVTSEGLAHKGDTTHFDSYSATLLGERFASEMLKLCSAKKGNAAFLNNKSFNGFN